MGIRQGTSVFERRATVSNFSANGVGFQFWCDTNDSDWTDAERHGHWNLFYYDPKNAPFWWVKLFNWLPASFLDNRYMRKAMKELGRRVLGLGPNFECCVAPPLLPYFNFSERRDIYAPGGIENTLSLFDDLERERRGYRVYTYHQCSDAEIFRRSLRDIKESDASFFFLYLCEVDAFLHMHCKDEQAIDEKLQWYEKQLRQVFQAAKERDPDTWFAVTSDHGMTPISHYADIVGEVAKLGLRMPQDYLAVYDSTMARFWFFDETARQRVTDLMQSLDSMGPGRRPWQSRKGTCIGPGSPAS